MAASVRLCLSQRNSPNTSLMDDVRAASEAGFTALDLWAPKLDDFLTTYPTIWLDMEMQKHRIYATSVSGVELLISGARDDVLVHEAHFLELCTQLDALGGGTIVVWPGTNLENDKDSARAMPWLVRALRSYSDLAAPFEVRVALEFQADPHSAVRTLAASQKVVLGIERRNVGLALSIDQLRESGDTSEDIETLDVKKLWLVRLESAPPADQSGRTSSPASGGEAETPSPVDFTGEGWGGGLLPTTLQLAVCDQLAAKGFRGPYCVEWPALELSEQPSTTPNALIERARRAHQAALELLASVYA